MNKFKINKESLIGLEYTDTFESILDQFESWVNENIYKEKIQEDFKSYNLVTSIPASEYFEQRKDFIEALKWYAKHDEARGNIPNEAKKVLEKWGIK